MKATPRAKWWLRLGTRANLMLCLATGILLGLGYGLNAPCLSLPDLSPRWGTNVAAGVQRGNLKIAWTHRREYGVKEQADFSPATANYLLLRREMTIGDIDGEGQCCWVEYCEQVTILLWPCFVLLAIWPGYALLRTIRGRESDSSLCCTCGYDLTGNTSGTCPECGLPLPVPASAPPGGGVD
jgi:hypothetical protein